MPIVFMSLLTPVLARAVLTWSDVDTNKDSRINEEDMGQVLSMLACPDFGICSISGTPSTVPTVAGQPTTTPKPTDKNYVACPIGTQLLSSDSVAFVEGVINCPAYVFTGNVEEASIIFPKLVGWQRGIGGGSLQQIQNKPATAKVFKIENDYEYLVYGPESGHNAGSEALNPEINVPKAKKVATDAGKKLMYAPSVEDYESNIPNTRGLTASSLVPQVAAYVDYWGIQLGNRQGLVDKGRTSKADFEAWLAQWSTWIKSGNPDTKIIVQLGIGEHDPINKICQQSPGIDYILDWRDLISKYADGIMIMPAQPCQPCPDDPNPGFVCTNDLNNIIRYKQYFITAKQAVEKLCQ